MAAATIVSNGYKLHVPFVIYEWELSSLTSDQQEILTHTHTGCTPNRVDVFVSTEPTDGSIIVGRLVSYSTSNNTVTVRIMNEVGGDPSGAKVKVWAYFFDAASGGTTPT